MRYVVGDSGLWWGMRSHNGGPGLSGSAKVQSRDRLSLCIIANVYIVIVQQALGTLLAHVTEQTNMQRANHRPTADRSSRGLLQCLDVDPKTLSEAKSVFRLTS
jgi:hypothetical protein